MSIKQSVIQKCHETAPFYNGVWNFIGENKRLQNFNLGQWCLKDVGFEARIDATDPEDSPIWQQAAVFFGIDSQSLTIARQAAEIKRLREVLGTIHKSFEDDGMENMTTRCNYIYKWSGEALEPQTQESEVSHG
jgi:hypothetical protein